MRKVMFIIAIMLLMVSALNAEWFYDKQEDLVSGEVSRVMMLKAEVYQGTLRAPYLVLRYDGSEYDVLVSWGGYSLDRDMYSIIVKFSGEPKLWDVNLSTNNEATFIVDTETFIDELLDAEKVVMQAKRATGVSSIARWDLSGFAEALATLRGEE